MSKFLIFISTAIFFFVIGIFVEYNNLYPYSSIKSQIKNILVTNNVIFNDYGFSECDLETISIKNVNEKEKLYQTLIVGHIYTSNKNDNYINTFQDFISIENIKFKNTLLLGDIFLEPSVSKWKLLKKDIKKISQNLFLVPGNHDVGESENTKRDIFFQLFENLPMYISENNFDLIMLDSTIGKNFLNKSDINFILNSVDNNKNKENLFIATHHLLRPDLNKISNMQIFNNEVIMEKIDKIIKKLNFQYKKIYFLAGDLGNKKNFDCMNKDNIYFISVGLSGKKNDLVLVYDNIKNNFYKINLTSNK